jgi:hypothetical protein
VTVAPADAGFARTMRCTNGAGPGTRCAGRFLADPRRDGNPPMRFDGRIGRDPTPSGDVDI